MAKEVPQHSFITLLLLAEFICHPNIVPFRMRVQICQKWSIGQGAVIVAWSWCWDYGVVDWDWLQLQTARSCLDSVSSLNCVGESLSAFCKGSPILSKIRMCESIVDSPLSLSGMSMLCCCMLSNSRHNHRLDVALSGRKTNDGDRFFNCCRCSSRR